MGALPHLTSPLTSRVFPQHSNCGEGSQPPTPPAPRSVDEPAPAWEKAARLSAPDPAWGLSFKTINYINYS